MKIQRTYTASAAVACALALLLAACGGSQSSGSSAPGVSEGEIVIGSDVPLTGPASFVGKGFKLGTKLAVDEINKDGGINGRKLKVRFEDDEGTPAGGVSAIRKLVQEDNVFAVLSGGGSSSVVAEVPFARQSKIPFYVSLASDERVTDPFSKYVYMGGTIPRAAISVSISQFLVDHLKAQHVAMLIDDEAQCQSGATQVKDAVTKEGAKVVTRQDFHAGDTNFAAQAQALRSADPDATYICGLASDAGKIIPQLKRAQVPGDLVGDGQFLDDSAIQALGSDGEGVYTFYTSSTQYIGDDTGAMGKWLARLHKANPDVSAADVNHYALFGYVDTYVVAEGLRRLADKGLTRDGFLKALDSLDGFTAGKDKHWTGAVPIGLPRSFTANDHVGNKTTQPMQVVDGALKPVGDAQ